MAYSREFRERVLNLVRGGVTVTAAAREAGVARYSANLQVRIHGMARPLGSDEKDAPNFEDFPYDVVVAFEMVQERE